MTPPLLETRAEAPAEDDPTVTIAGSHETTTGRRSRRRRVAITAIVVIGLGAGATVWLRRDGAAPAPASAQAATTTAKVTVRDLVVTESFDGTLGYGSASPLTAGRAGIVTSVTPVGTVVNPGQALLAIDLQPTVLLTGPVPAFRVLEVGVAAGADVAQLEQALVDLGHGDGITVDQEYTAATAAGVERWETALGRFDPDGTVERGDIVFAPGAVRVSTISTTVGTQVQTSTTVVEATPTAKVVSLSLGTDDAGRLEPGTALRLTLPDKATTSGRVTNIGVATTATNTGQGTGGTGGAGGAGGTGGTGGANTPTVPVTVTIDDPAAAARFESGTVKVVLEQARTDDATAVPVTALLALAEGGYAVQVVDAGQPTGYRLTRVEVGRFADGWVQVTGQGIRADVAVVVPK